MIETEWVWLKYRGTPNLETPPPPPPVSRHELPCKGQEQTTLRHCTSTHDALAPPFFPKYAGDTRDTRAPRHPLVMNARRYPASLLATPVVWVSGLVTWCKRQTMESQDWLSSLQSLLFVLLCCRFCFVVCGRRCVCRGWCRRRRRAPSARGDTPSGNRVVTTAVTTGVSTTALAGSLQV